MQKIKTSESQIVAMPISESPFTLTQTLPSAIYTFTQVPGGDAGAMRLTLISVVISMGALLASELLARRVGAQPEQAK